MKMELTVSSETSAIRTQMLGNYSKRNKLLCTSFTQNHIQGAFNQHFIYETCRFPRFISRVNNFTILKLHVPACLVAYIKVNETYKPVICVCCLTCLSKS